MATQLIPWMNPECFGRVPLTSKDPITGYGYLKGKKLHPYLTQEELIITIKRDDNNSIQLCWTPEHIHPVVPEEIPFLYEAVLKRKKSAAENPTAMLMGVISIVLLGSFLTLSLVDALEHGVGALLSDSATLSGIQYLIVLLVGFGFLPLVQRWWQLRELKTYTFAKLRKEIPEIRYLAWLHQQKSIWSMFLLVCIGLVGLSQLLAGVEASVAATGLVKDMVRKGEWWRLITAPFLHVSFLHIYLNAISLYALGNMVESTTNRVYVLVIFIFSAISGSLFSLFLLPDASSVGASGGVMGLLGFLIVFEFANRKVFPKTHLKRLINYFLLNLAIGVLGYGFIDNAAHVGGFFAGIIVGLFLSRRIYQIPQDSTKLSDFILGSAAVILLLVVGFTTITIFQYQL